MAREGLHPRKSRSRATIADAVSRVVKASLRAYGAMNGAYVSLGVLRGVVMIPGKCLTRRASSGLRQDERNGMHYDVGLLASREMVTAYFVGAFTLHPASRLHQLDDTK